MSKRRLTIKQTRRINKNHDARLNRAKHYVPALEDENSLGPEQDGLIVTHFGTQVEVENCESGERNRCHVRANLDSLVTGDRVIWQAGQMGNVVVSTQPRQSVLERPDAYGKMKAVAANIDQIIIIIAPQPEPHYNLIDRYIVAAENADIAPLIVLNKIELIEERDQSWFINARKIYTQLGYPWLEISSKQSLGFEALERALKDNTSVFVGQSGVGKSSIIQKLLPNEEIRIGKLSKNVNKGRHTTTHSRLYHFTFSGMCIDSPGIREFGVQHFSLDEISYGFREIREYASKCRFNDCKHDIEPGCEVRTALKGGHINEIRYKSFQQTVNSVN